MTIAPIVPEASPISHPPESPGVPQLGLSALAMRMPQNTTVGIAMAVPMPARQPMPPESAAGGEESDRMPG